MSGPPPTPSDGWAWALFLDIDGTLLDLAPTPDGVRLPPTLSAQLRALSLGLGGALALVSGRPLSDIDRLFPERFDAAGTHGAQWRLGGIETGPEPVDGTDLSEARALLREAVIRLPGTLLEHKPHALALHYRLAPELESEIRALAVNAGQALGPAYRLQTGKSVIEILPAWAGKGMAIRRFMGLPPYAGRTPVFAGDDLTDEDGFAAVNALGGYSIRVGEWAATQAPYRLDSPSALRDWLASLIARLPQDPSRGQP